MYFYSRYFSIYTGGFDHGYTTYLVTLKNVAADLAEMRGISKKDMEEILNDMVGLFVRNLQQGNRVRIPGLDILQVKDMKARMGRITRPPVKPSISPLKGPLKGKSLSASQRI